MPTWDGGTDDSGPRTLPTPAHACPALAWASTVYPSVAVVFFRSRLCLFPSSFGVISYCFYCPRDTNASPPKPSSGVQCRETSGAELAPRWTSPKGMAQDDWQYLLPRLLKTHLTCAGKTGDKTLVTILFAPEVKRPSSRTPLHQPQVVLCFPRHPIEADQAATGQVTMAAFHFGPTKRTIGRCQRDIPSSRFHQKGGGAHFWGVEGPKGLSCSSRWNGWKGSFASRTTAS